jgi:hypothetical protein
MRYLFLFTLTLILTSESAFSQIFRHYLSTDLEMSYEKDEEWKKRIREKEIVFEQYFANEFLLFENDDIAVKHVQVVFNILQTEDKKISYDQIKQQLKALNAAFNNEIKMPEDDFYKGQAYSAGIQFCVPEYSEKFIRVVTLPKGTVIRDMFSERGEQGIAAFEPEKYVNIWVADLGQYNPQGQEFSIAGYAQLPMRDPLKDGIVIDIDHFGEQPRNELYSKGLTLPHLMGMYLGIGPLWGLYGDGQCGGDFVDDTPTHPGPSLVCLPQTENQLVVSSCWGNERMMNKNFMDNVPDDCAAMFTLGQRRKMHANLGKKGPRAYLIPSEPFNCNDGRPTAVVDNDVVKANKVKVMPNPAHSQITINIEGNIENSYFSIYNLSGQLMIKGEMESTSKDINVTEWPAGMYYLMVNQHQNKISNVQKVTFEVIR